MTQILPGTFTATPGFRFPVFLTSSIDQKLGIYKNLLKEKGIDNISDEGHLIFERKNGIAITPSSGITSGKLKPGFILYEPHHSLRTRIPNIIRPS